MFLNAPVLKVVVKEDVILQQATMLAAKVFQARSWGDQLRTQESRALTC